MVTLCQKIFNRTVVIIHDMKIEFDENKSASNLAKHGIDFHEARALWSDRDLLEIPAKTVEDANLSLIIGKIDKKHWSAVITYRGDSIRIISVRRSREKEIQYYEG
jgi:uncharacterized protein